MESFVTPRRAAMTSSGVPPARIQYPQLRLAVLKASKGEVGVEAGPPAIRTSGERIVSGLAQQRLSCVRSTPTYADAHAIACPKAVSDGESKIVSLLV
jgi:hypothetical protein